MKDAVKQDSTHYTLPSYILLFFTFATMGWLFEVLLQFLVSGHFVNKGALHGWWLPIYGWGGIGSILLSKKIYNHPVFCFIIAMIMATIMEYGTSIYLEITQGVQYWDYSQFLFNIQGRICLEAAITFGIACLLAIYIIGPKLNSIFQNLPKKVQTILPVCLIILFLLDNVYSFNHPPLGAGITNYNTSHFK